MRWTPVVVVVLLVSSALADLYLHNPRGSNNRLNERSANRRNGNRVFDSQVSLGLRGSLRIRSVDSRCRLCNRVNVVLCDVGV